MISFATTQLKLRKIFKTERIFFFPTLSCGPGLVRDAIYTHLHFLPQKKTILTVGCPTQESVVFAWLKSHHWLMPDFAQLNVCFSLSISKGSIDDGLLACTPRILDALGLLEAAVFSGAGLWATFLFWAQGHLCVCDWGGDHSVRPFLEMKRERIFTQSVSLQSHTPKLRKNSGILVITFRLFLSICSFVYSFNVSILRAGLWGKMRKEQRL